MVLPNKITQIYQTRIYIFYSQIRYHIKHNIKDRILGTFMLRQVFLYMICCTLNFRGAGGTLALGSRYSF